MNSSCSLGSDGFSGGFYNCCWNIISHDIVESVQYFFILGEMPDNFNPIHVYLIPKSHNVDRVQKFRPIALANFQYKIIAKLLANSRNLITL